MDLAPEDHQRPHGGEPHLVNPHRQRWTRFVLKISFSSFDNFLQYFSDSGWAIVYTRVCTRFLNLTIWAIPIVQQWQYEWFIRWYPDSTHSSNTLNIYLLKQDHPEGVRVIIADPMADCLPGTGIPCTGDKAFISQEFFALIKISLISSKIESSVACWQCQRCSEQGSTEQPAATSPSAWVKPPSYEDNNCEKTFALGCLASFYPLLQSPLI